MRTPGASDVSARPGIGASTQCRATRPEAASRGCRCPHEQQSIRWLSVSVLAGRQAGHHWPGLSVRLGTSAKPEVGDVTVAPGPGSQLPPRPGGGAARQGGQAPDRALLARSSACLGVIGLQRVPAATGSMALPATTAQISRHAVAGTAALSSDLAAASRWPAVLTRSSRHQLQQSLLRWAGWPAWPALAGAPPAG